MNDPVEHPTAKSIRQSLEMVAGDRTQCFEELGRAQAEILVLRGHIEAGDILYKEACKTIAEQIARAEAAESKLAALSK